MPWPLRFLTGPEPWWGEFIDGKAHPQIGDCWYHPNWVEGDVGRDFFVNHQASRQYKEQWADKRPPVIIRLPSGPFSPDEFYSRPENRQQREGWTVTGSIEDGSLTVRPSVNIVGYYHGWIQNGSVSDDVEGRRSAA